MLNHPGRSAKQIPQNNNRASTRACLDPATRKRRRPGLNAASTSAPG